MEERIMNGEFRCVEDDFAAASFFQSKTKKSKQAVDVDSLDENFMQQIIDAPHPYDFDTCEDLIFEKNIG